MPQIYIIYRPEDTRKKSKEIIETLQKTYGASNISFPNFDSYVDVYDIERRVQKTDFLLVIIGNYWVDMVDESGMNLIKSVYDPVHMAIATAISSHKRIIPILVDGATMPFRAKLPHDLRPLITQEPIKIDKNDSVSKALNKGLKDIIQRQSRIKLPDLVSHIKLPQRPSTPQPRLRQPRPPRNQLYWLKHSILPIGIFIAFVITMAVLFVPAHYDTPISTSVNTVTPVLATIAPTSMPTITMEIPTEIAIQSRPKITVENASQLVQIETDNISMSQTEPVIFSQDQTLFIFISPEFQEVQIRDITSNNLRTISTSPQEPRAIQFNDDETLLYVLLNDGQITAWGIPTE